MGVALLVGCGSIGRRHVRYLLKYVDKVVVIDPNPSVSNQLVEFGDNVELYLTIQELKKNSSLLLVDYEILVLANWAPDRKQSIQELSPLRYKRILIEKPAASSLADVEWLSNHVKSAGISGAVNLHLRFSRLPEVISTLEIEYKLGKALKIFELGGAKCFSTNGIHWLDFAISRFSSDPVTVQSSNRFQKINPRSTNLYFVDGNAIWGFTDNRTFEISYSNDSSFPSRLLILYKHGLITVEEEKLILELQQNHIDDAEFPITRTTSPTGRIEIEDVFNWDSNEDGISRLYSVIFNEKCDIDDFLNSTRALLASFSASKTGLLKLLPKDWNDREEILNHDFFTDWQVT